jgi:hypothetical protein
MAPPVATFVCIMPGAIDKTNAVFLQKKCRPEGGIF